MTLAQEHKAFAELLCWLENDWVQLPAVVSFVNEATGFSPGDTVTEDTRSFVARLIREEEIVAGSVSASGFAPWTGKKEEMLERVLGLMPVGHSVGEEWSVWFDRPDKRRANQSVQHNAGSRPVSVVSPASESPSLLGPRG
jgi:hypothetical protein